MKNIVKRLAYRARGFLLEPLEPLHSLLGTRPDGAEAAAQVALRMMYQQRAQQRLPLPPLADAGFKVYSQADEDGILLYIFALVGTTNKQCVEICAGSGRECNTANLILNHHWSGLLFDGNAAAVAAGRAFYRRHPATYVYPPRFVNAWITRENVNQLLRENNVTGEIDLLSLDIDGIDYWLWEAIDAIAPRVVVLEYQDILGPERACTVPYRDDFSKHDYPTTDGMPNFAGASLPAFVKLGRRKGYRLVGCNVYGYNAFFIRHDVGADLLPEFDLRQCFQHPKVVWGIEHRYPTVKDLPWVDV